MADPPEPREDSNHGLRAPFLEALERMQNQDASAEKNLAEEAKQAMEAVFDSSGRRIETYHQIEQVCLCGEHTHFFNGFALQMATHQGVGVAVRRSLNGKTTIYNTASDQRYTLGTHAPTRPPEYIRSLRVLLTSALLERHGTENASWEIVIHPTIAPDEAESFLSSMLFAVLQAVARLEELALDDRKTVTQIHKAVCQILQRPFGFAYPLGVQFGTNSNFTLIDTATRECLAVDAVPSEKLRWGVFETGIQRSGASSFFIERDKQAKEALDHLRSRAFPDLTSYRYLEHKDLQQALDQLPAKLVPVVRHLVTENRRIHKYVKALRHEDTQLLGGLMLMSQASLKNMWGNTCQEVDWVTDQARGVEGMYGARMVGTGFGGRILVAGRPFVIAQFLHDTKQRYMDEFSSSPEIHLL